MKIIWITSQFPSNLESIKGIYLYRTVKYLSKYYNIEVWYLYPKIPPLLNILKNPLKARDAYNYWKKNLPDETIELNGLESNKIKVITYFRLPRVFFHFLEAYFIYWEIKKKKYKIDSNDLLYANWIFPAGHLASIISRFNKNKYIVSLLGTDVHKIKKNTIYMNFAKSIVENSDFVVSVSKELIDRCKRFEIAIPENKSEIIDNIYDINKFKKIEGINLRQKYGYENHRKIILFVGGLVSIKNIDVLIDAFNKLKRDDCDLIIAGKGPEESKLKKIASTSYYSKQIKFIGNLQSEKLIEYYNLADLLCLPSKNEGTPNVIIESLFTGLPVIASKVGGIPKLIKDNVNGILVLPNDADSLSFALNKGLSFNWDYKVIQNTVNKFNPNIAVKKYIKVFELIK